MKYARIIDNYATDVRAESPTGFFTPNIVAEFQSVPDTVANGWILTAGVWAAPPVVPPYVPTAAEIAAVAAAKLATEKSSFIIQVKAEAGALTSQVLKGLESEYELAEAEATAYKAAGYPATVPLSVADEVASKAAKGITITATVACDNILAAAVGWRNAQAALRRNRLTVTSAAEVAVDAAALDAIKAGRETFMAALRTQLGV